MALRFVEIRLPVESHDEAKELAKSQDLIDHWWEQSGEKEIHRYLCHADKVESLVDSVRATFGDSVRIVILPVEATLPRLDDAVNVTPPEEKRKGPNRVSREEMVEDISERIKLNPVFLTLAAVSTVVACIGLTLDDNIALIGAMVIAPLLGPNVGLSLATTLGDLRLGRKALLSGGAGIGLSLAISVAFGWLFGAPDSAAIASRVAPGLAAIALALASGMAGGLAFTSGAPASLIGVMVAVALLPPLAAGGMLLGAGDPGRSTGAFLLLGVNLVAVNLAGVVTFLAQGIHPVWSRQKESARRATWRAIGMWTSALILLALGIYLVGR